MLSEAIRRIHNKESMSYLFKNVTLEDWMKKYVTTVPSHVKDRLPQYSISWFPFLILSYCSLLVLVLFCFYICILGFLFLTFVLSSWFWVLGRRFLIRESEIVWVLTHLFLNRVVNLAAHIFLVASFACIILCKPFLFHSLFLRGVWFHSNINPCAIKICAVHFDILLYHYIITSTL